MLCNGRLFCHFFGGEMGAVISLVADRFDGHGPVIETPIENLAIIAVCERRANRELSTPALLAMTR